MASHGDLNELQRQIREMPVGEALKEQMRALKESVSNARIDAKIQQDIRLNMEKARQAYEQALKNAGDANSALEPARKALAELAKAIGKLGENTAASLTAKTKNTTGETTETTIDRMVKTDGSGTIMLLRSPKLHLTFHDKNAKLVFDGEIETAEQRDKVPREIWEKVEPLIKKMTPGVEKQEPKNDSAEAL